MHRLWEWVLEDAVARRADRPASPVFTSRFEAEEWLGAHWRVLAAQGVRVARLEHAGVAVGSAVVFPLDRLRPLDQLRPDDRLRPGASPS